MSTLPTTPDALFARLDELGIETHTVQHPAVFTVEQARLHRKQSSGTHIKNLFLRNKKGAMWLVIAREDRSINLKALGKRIGAGHLSFGSAERLMRNLGVEPGAVTPFGLLNDVDRAVSVVLDAGILQSDPSHQRDPIHCHPLVNTMTTAIDGAALLRFIEACGHQASIVDLAPEADHA